MQKIILIFILLWGPQMNAKIYSKYPITDHFDGKRFYHEGLNADKNPFVLLKWNLNRPDAVYPEWTENQFQPQLNLQLKSNEVAVTFVNHSTFLIQINGLNFLTDPVWAERVSPFSFVGPKRVRPPGIKFENLPKIDFVLVSHNHYDHMDIETLKKIHDRDKSVFYMPLANSIYFEHVKNMQIIELDWWDSHQFNSKFKITLVPAQHWSARGLTDRRKALWGGFVVETENKKIFFAGDTGYSDKIFKKIGEKFKSIDLSFIPIGAYEPRWFMKSYHNNPDEAVLIHQDIKSKQSIGMHFGCFRLSDEKWGQAEIDLAHAKTKYKVDQFTTVNVGETKLFK